MVPDTKVPTGSARHRPLCAKPHRRWDRQGGEGGREHSAGTDERPPVRGIPVWRHRLGVAEKRRYPRGTDGGTPHQRNRRDIRPWPTTGGHDGAGGGGGQPRCGRGQDRAGGRGGGTYDGGGTAAAAATAAVADDFRQADRERTPPLACRCGSPPRHRARRHPHPPRRHPT